MPETLRAAPPPAPADPGREEARAAKERVRRYYAAATEDYLRYYETDWHHHMHYGFDRELPKGGNPTEHMVRYLAGLAGLRAGERLLDAGCGVGGSSIFLARELGLDCAGITLVESQARLARGFAAKSGPGAGKGRARFAVSDFHAPPFKPGSFDAVWALESFDHAVDKRAWIRSMAGLLRPGGRLVIADGFRAGNPRGPAQAKAYSGFLAGWAVPDLCTGRELETWAAEAGLACAHSEDISAAMRWVDSRTRAVFLARCR